MPAMPTALVPTIQGYVIGAPTGVVQTSVGGGSSRFGLEWDKGKQPYQVRHKLDAEKFSVWATFFLHTIKQGSIGFTMPLDSGFGVADHDCNIVPSSVAAAREGKHTIVTYTVESESGAYALTSGEAEALIAAYNGYASTSPPEIPRDFKPISRGYSMSGPGGNFRTEVPGGAPRFALDWDRDVQNFSVTLILTAAKFQVWTAFLHHKIAKGSISFTMPLDSGFGSLPHTVTILPGSYSASRSGAHWMANFSVEAESSVFGMTAAEAAALLELYAELGPGASALLERLAQYANEDILVLQ